MTTKALLEDLCTDLEWAQGQEWEAPICLVDDLRECIRLIDDFCRGTLPDGRICHYSDVIGGVAAIPAADVVPVKHAHWEAAIGYDQRRKVVCCGNDGCGRMAYEPSTYCPNCGAKMDEEEM